MANLNYRDKKLFEELLQMQGGYVLDFTNHSFQEFFSGDFNIDIYSDKYHTGPSRSKANLLRAFWNLESDQLVGRVMRELVQLAESLNPDSGLLKKCKQIIARLTGESIQSDEEAFLSQQFEISLDRINLPDPLSNIIQQRLGEIDKSFRVGAYLSAIFLSGSTLEGLLMHHASSNWGKYKSCCKKSLNKWTLNDLINGAYKCGDIQKHVKDYSHSLRNFRNYIHPYHQMQEDFLPDENTAKISWQVLQAAISDLNK